MIQTQGNKITWPRLLLAVILLVGGILAALFLFWKAHAANPASGTIGTSGPTRNWTGTVSGTGGTGGEGQCIDSGPAQNCDSFALTVSGTEADWAGKLIQVRVGWSLQAADYDLYIHKGDLTGPVAAQGTNAGQPGTEEVAFVDARAAGVGLYTVHVAYAATIANNDQYQGSVSVLPDLTVAPLGSGLPPRFQNFNPQPELIKAGKGLDAGEPSIGLNWKTGRAMFISDLTTLRVKFNDSCPTSPTSFWEDKSAPNNAESLDPILFTDHGYNRQIPDATRTIVSELTGQDSLSAYSDDDGETWIPSQGGGIPSGVDHQTVGAGPFHAPLVPNPLYPHAIYYCSQDIEAAFCARSDDGGLTFGPGVVTHNFNQGCDGIHGHVKVGPDGTVYLPVRACSNNTAAIVSEDNGVSWSIRQIPGSNSSNSDPAIGVGRGDKTSGIGRVYEAFGSSDSVAGVSVSDDRGNTWRNSFDVGSLVGIKDVAFPAIVAGDDDRAAFAFLGSTNAGSPDDKAFPGLWHLYVATTYDGGAHWLVSDATPNDPVQRNGIHLGGGSPPHRNLLDFIGIDLDKQGRVLVAYADGCTGPGCVQAPDMATGNAYTAVAAIARQTGGRRLFAGNDPAEPGVPGAPSITVGRDGGVAHLTWSEPDNGGSPITSYKVYRGTFSGGETLLKNVGTATTYLDVSANPNTDYYYKVTATNQFGTSCGNNEIVANPVGDSKCQGMVIALDPSGDQVSNPLNPDLDIQEVRLADYIDGGVQKVVFKMKVSDLHTLQPNRQWRFIWNYPRKADGIDDSIFTGSYYVGMNTDNSAVPSFEYGTVTTIESVPANLSQPNRVGDADSGYTDQQNGTITLVLSAAKIGGPKAGDVIGGIIGRTFAGTGDESLRSNTAIDTTSNAIRDPYTGSAFLIFGNTPCGPTPTPTPTPSPLPCNGTAIEDDNATIAYSNGWHLVTSSSASAGHFRVNEGGSQPTAVLSFDTQSGQSTSSITYIYGTSPKGGSAQILLDGVLKQTIDYSGSSGSNRSPVFGSSITLNYGSGHHLLEIKPMHDAVYIDGFCLGNAVSSGQPSTGPGTTSDLMATLSAGQETLRSITLPAGTQAIAIAADPTPGVPLQLVLVGPSGQIIQTINSSGGVAILEAPISQSGVYLIKTINASLGPVQVWSVATPLVTR